MFMLYMRNLTVLLLCAVCAIMNVAAQTVASSPTAVSALKNGYYVLKMKSDKTDDNGSFVYRSGSNVKFDAKESDHNLAGRTIDDVNYVFYVANNNGQLTIKAFDKNDYYWPSIPKASNSDEGCNPGQQSQFSLSGNALNFTFSETQNGWGYLKASADKCVKTGWFWWPYDRKNIDVYVVANNGDVLGYYDTDANATNNAQFQFYAVNDMPDAANCVTLKYDFYYDGVYKKTQTVSTAVIGKNFPTTGVPDFVDATLPEGLVSASNEGQSFTINCTSTLPFQLSTDANPVYYYLENVKGVRLHNNGDLSYRAAEQAATLNDVRNDLWYVKGNPFDGYQFSNVGSGNLLHSAAIMSDVTSLAFSGAANNTSSWSIYKTNNGFGVCPVAGSMYAHGTLWLTWENLTDANNKDYSWRLDDDGNGVGFKNYNADDEAFSFRMVEPTFEVELYNVPGQGTFNSTALPFDFAIAEDYDGDAKLYKGAVSNKELNLSEVAAVPANAGVVLMGTNSESIKLVAKAGAEALEGNDLIGTTSEINVSNLSDKLIFGVSNETGLVGFFSTDGSANLPANRAYLPNTNGIQAVMVNLGGNTTGISGVENGVKNDAPVYDLSGRRVVKMVKGSLYIQNGRKFIAR